MDLPKDMDLVSGKEVLPLVADNVNGSRSHVPFSVSKNVDPGLVTSALDYLTERTVCENLRRELSGDTVFFITHSLATIRSADSIMLMENGLLQEVGTHQQLLTRKGLYYALYRQQDASIN